jgi:hypothetical protein
MRNNWSWNSYFAGMGLGMVIIVAIYELLRGC